MPSVYGGNVPDVFHPTLGAIWTQEMENAKPSWMAYLDEKSTGILVDNVPGFKRIVEKGVRRGV